MFLRSTAGITVDAGHVSRLAAFARPIIITLGFGLDASLTCARGALPEDIACRGFGVGGSVAVEQVGAVEAFATLSTAVGALVVVTFEVSTEVVVSLVGPGAEVAPVSAFRGRRLLWLLCLRLRRRRFSSHEIEVPGRQGEIRCGRRREWAVGGGQTRQTVKPLGRMTDDQSINPSIPSTQSMGMTCTILQYPGRSTVLHTNSGIHSQLYFLARPHTYTYTHARTSAVGSLAGGGGHGGWRYYNYH